MIILEIAMGILLFFGLVFVILLCVAVINVRNEKKSTGLNSIQDIGEQVNVVIIDKQGNKIHIN